MLQFKQDDTSIELILTLTEKVTINEPYYFFEFIHVTTRQVVSFLKSPIEDESNYPNRYNSFSIDPSTLFANMPPGEWHYKVYQIGHKYRVGDYSHNTAQVTITDLNGDTINRLIIDGVEYEYVPPVGESMEIEPGPFQYGALSITPSNGNFIFNSANVLGNDTEIFISINDEEIVLEVGKLMILRSTEFEFTQYEAATTFKQYNG
jgi:hypothetical protein